MQLEIIACVLVSGVTYYTGNRTLLKASVNLANPCNYNGIKMGNIHLRRGFRQIYLLLGRQLDVVIEFPLKANVINLYKALLLSVFGF